jgi:redox-sensitive bicupin YhaK (pirin superfamily)
MNPSLKDVSPTTVLSAVDVDEGLGARVRRLFPTLTLRHLDPFVVLDEFRVEPPAALPVARQGFEALTYMIEGLCHHRDSLGNDGTVEPGGAQRFTAGHGVVHAQTPSARATNHGLQLWVNVPARLSEVEPTYQRVSPSQIPEHRQAGVVVRTVVGDGSPVRLLTPVRYLDVSLAAGARYDADIPDGWNGFAYLLRGRITLAGADLLEGRAGLPAPGRFRIEALEDSRLVLISGQPHRKLQRA